MMTMKKYLKKSFPLVLELVMKQRSYVVNEKDEYPFAASDILIKLPSSDFGAHYVKALI